MQDENLKFSIPKTEHGRGVILAILQKLHEEWNLGPSGYRRDEIVVGTLELTEMRGVEEVTPAQGLITTILERRLLSWYRNLELTQSQLEPVLERLKKSGLLNSFKFSQAQWTEHDEPQTVLRLEFNPSFEVTHEAYKQYLYANADSTDESNRMRRAESEIQVLTKHGLLTLDVQTGEGSYGAVKFSLHPTGKEFDFLRKLMRSPNYSITYSEIEADNTTQKRLFGDVLKALKNKLGILPLTNPDRNEDIFHNQKLYGYRLLI